jgi:hypothetical protein
MNAASAINEMARRLNTYRKASAEVLVTGRGRDFVVAHSKQQHVQDYGHIQQKNDPFVRMGMAHKRVHFEGQIDTARDQGKPLRPDPVVPQAHGLSKTQYRIHNCGSSDQPEISFGDPIHDSIEKIGKPPLWVEMKDSGETVYVDVQILVN